ncbi:Hsp20/alpha crystallin family protein [Planctomicrobium sp. SH664]|uniref:Hsp20/alpha crystallin family protein n=1 Tax=Planctomicrobium sp. SH664 TaxID=3448125 RepID=UPI003F5CB870
MSTTTFYEVPAMTDSFSPREPRGARSWFPPTSFHAFKQEMNDLLENFLGETLPAWRGDSGPRLDVVETPEAVEVTADVPGYQPEEISIDLAENHLSISGTRKVESEPQDCDKKYHRLERRQQQFSRSVWLPCPVDQDKIEATLSQGLLKVRLPKLEASKRRKIPIQGTSPQQG